MTKLCEQQAAFTILVAVFTSMSVGLRKILLFCVSIPNVFSTTRLALLSRTLNFFCIIHNSSLGDGAH
jgi:hypothetical protein